MWAHVGAPPGTEVGSFSATSTPGYHAIVEKFRVDGTWWLPTNPESRVPGCLVHDESGLQLTLYGAWDQTDDAPIGGLGHWISESHAVVYGSRYENNQTVTLINLRGSVLRVPWAAPSPTCYSVQAAFLGDVRSPSSGFVKASVDLDFLKAWTQPPSRRLNADLTLNEVHLRTDSIRIEESILDDQTLLTLRSGLEGTEDDSSANLSEYCAFDFAFAEPQSWERVVDYVQQCQDLLTLTLGMHVRVDRVYVYSEADRPGVLACYATDEIMLIDPSSDNQRDNAVISYLSPALLTARSMAGAELKTPLSRILTRWFGIYSEFAYSLELLLARYAAREMLPIHSYSSLFGALESLHKQMDLGTLAVPKQVHSERRGRVADAVNRAATNLSSDSAPWLDESDKAWLDGLIARSRNDRSIQQKISDLLGQTKDVGEAIHAVSGSFTADAARMRGRASHGSVESASNFAKRRASEYVIEYAVRVAIVQQLLDDTDRDEFCQLAAQRTYFKRGLTHLESSFGNEKGAAS